MESQSSNLPNKETNTHSRAIAVLPFQLASSENVSNSIGIAGLLYNQVQRFDEITSETQFFPVKPESLLLGAVPQVEPKPIAEAEDWQKIVDYTGVTLSNLPENLIPKSIAELVNKLTEGRKDPQIWYTVFWENPKGDGKLTPRIIVFAVGQPSLSPHALPNQPQPIRPNA